MAYDILLAYERQSSGLEDDELAESVIGEPAHSSNLPWFGVLALDFIRTLQWRVETLSAAPQELCERLRDSVPNLRGFTVLGEGCSASSDAHFPVFTWRDEEWVAHWRVPF